MNQPTLEPLESNCYVSNDMLDIGVNTGRLSFFVLQIFEPIDLHLQRRKTVRVAYQEGVKHRWSREGANHHGR